MPTFEVFGPHKVPTYNGKAAKIVDFEALPDFWSYVGLLSKRKGCYVFAVRASKGLRPVYVGLATKTFKQEVFTPHKLEKYQRALADTAKGTPVLFFLAHPLGRGATNIRAIKDLEDYLIQAAVSKNSDLLNVKGTEKEKWGIAGVIRAGSGKPSAAAKALKRLLGI